MSKDKLHPLNTEEYRLLFDALYPSLSYLANRYLRDEDMSKDIVQDIFIKVWEKKPSFQNHNATKAYLYTSVKNQCLNYLKSKKYRTLLNSIKIDVSKIQSEEHFRRSGNC